MLLTKSQSLIEFGMGRGSGWRHTQQIASFFRCEVKGEGKGKGHSFIIIIMLKTIIIHSCCVFLTFNIQHTKAFLLAVCFNAVIMMAEIGMMATSFSILWK